MDVARAEAKIRESVDRVRREGVKIISNRFGVACSPFTTWGWQPTDSGDGPCCCPLGAVIVCEQPKQARFDSKIYTAAFGFEVTEDFISGFILGFDGCTVGEQADTYPGDGRAGLHLGVKMREEYIHGKEITSG